MSTIAVLAAAALLLVVAVVVLLPSEKEENTPPLSGIDITAMPTKTVYDYNEALDTAGLKITATYSDGSTALITGYTTSPEKGSLLNAGTQTIYVMYTKNGITETTSFNVNVGPAPKTLMSIAVTAMPTKTAYSDNEPLDLAGLKITATYNDGTTALITGYTVSPANGFILSTGTVTQTVYVMYEENGVTKTAIFDVTVS